MIASGQAARPVSDPVPPQQREPWLTPGRFALLSTLLLAISFPDVLLGKATFVIRDYGYLNYPAAFFIRESFRHGQVPLWNGLNYCGLPFLAQWNTMALYPIGLVYVLFPLSWSLPFFCLLHLFWGGLGMYFLARHWAHNCLAAGLAGLVFSFNGYALNSLMAPNHEASLSWLPWILWLAPAAWQQGGKPLVLACLAASLQLLAGGPEEVLFTWALLFALVSGAVLSAGQEKLRLLLRFLLIGGLVGVICAPQLLPFLQFSANSQRDSGFGKSDWPMPLWGWANFLVPLFRCVRTNFGIFQQVGQYFTSSYYVGIATVWLGVVALRRWRDPKVYLMIGVTLVALALALGDAGVIYRHLRLWIPALGFARYPVKFVILAVAASPLLAAFGLASLSTTSVLRRFDWVSASVLVLLTAAIVGFDRAFPLVRNTANVTLWNALVRVMLFALMVLLLVWFVKCTGRHRILLGSLFLVLCWVDLFTHVPNQNPTVRSYVYSAGWSASQLKFEPQPSLGHSRIMMSAHAYDVLKFNAVTNLEENYLLNRLAFMGDCNMLDGIPAVGGFFSIIPGKINNIVAFPLLHPEVRFPALMDFMGVSQTTAPGKVSEWTSRPTAMPLVTAGQEPVFADDSSAFALCFHTNTDFRETVLLPAEARSRVIANQQRVRVSMKEFSNQKVVAETEALASSLVVISQTWYPAWKAYVDGAPTALLRANYAFQAVQVPSGKHTVVVAYQDDAFRIGLILSGIGLAALFLIWFLAHLRVPI